MKKALSALTTLAALTVTAVAVGQEPPGGGPTPTPHDATNPPPPAAAAPGAAVPNVPPPPGSLPPVSPIAPEAPAEATEPAPQTTLTAADVGAAAPPRPPPRETITVRQTYRPNRPLLYTGGSMLISSYAITAGFTGLQNLRDANGDQPTYIPVAGPWIHLANSNMSLFDQSLLAGSGVVQGAGVLIGVLSFIVPERVPAATVQAGGVNVHVAASPSGIQAFGQF